MNKKWLMKCARQRAFSVGSVKGSVDVFAKHLKQRRSKAPSPPHPHNPKHDLCHDQSARSWSIAPRVRMSRFCSPHSALCLSPGRSEPSNKVPSSRNNGYTPAIHAVNTHERNRQKEASVHRPWHPQLQERPFGPRGDPEASTDDAGNQIE